MTDIFEQVILFNVDSGRELVSWPRGCDIGRHPVYVRAMISLCILGVILNLLVIFAVLKYSSYRASIDILLTNLAAGDILHAGIVRPIDLKNAVSYKADFYGNDTACKIIMFILLLSVMSAILTIVAIAIDRYRAIVLQKHIYRRGALKIIGGIWIISLIISAPQLYEYDVYVITDEELTNKTFKSCGSKGNVDNFETVYALAVFILAFLGPFLILTACYTKLVFYVYMHGRRFRRTRMTNTNISQKLPNDRVSDMLSTRMIKILKMLICITATFVFLWTPYFVIFGMTVISGTFTTNSSQRSFMYTFAFSTKNSVQSNFERKALFFKISCILETHPSFLLFGNCIRLQCVLILLLHHVQNEFLEWPSVVCRVMTVLSTISNPVIYLAFSETCRNAISNAWNDLMCRLLQPRQIWWFIRRNRVQPLQEVSNTNEVEIHTI